MDKDGTKDFFISYNKADREWAEWIAWQLEAEGYTTVLQAWDFLPGSNFVLDMDKASGQAYRTIAVLSPDYLTSNFTPAEWAAAFAQDPASQQGKLLPIRVRACTLSGLLAQLVYLDLVDLDEQRAAGTLRAGIARTRALLGAVLEATIGRNACSELVFSDQARNDHVFNMTRPGASHFVCHFQKRNKNKQATVTITTKTDSRLDTAKTGTKPIDSLDYWNTHRLAWRAQQSQRRRRKKWATWDSNPRPTAW